jgi:uncharacterized protein YjbI with pentapeptide repeats
MKAEPKSRAKPKSRWGLVGMILLALGLGRCGWSLYMHRGDVGRARAEVLRRGGSPAGLARNSWRLDEVNFAGKPITDADLAELAPLFAAANGPVTLDLSRTQVTDAGLAHCKLFASQLYTVRLEGLTIEGSGLAALARLGSDAGEDDPEPTLSLAHTSVDDDGLRFLAPMTRLAELNLAGTKVKGAGLRYLRGLRRLHDVNLEGAPVDDEGTAGLEGWSGLAQLNLAKTQVGDAGLARLRTLSGLQGLNLQGTRITDAGVGILVSWPKVTGISLADTALSDAAILRFKAPGTLVSLNLDGTGVTDDTLRQMAGWRKLYLLALERTRVTDAGLAYLLDLPDLERLYLTGANFTPQAIAGLKAKRPKMLIDY